MDGEIEKSQESERASIRTRGVTTSLRANRVGRGGQGTSCGVPVRVRTCRAVVSKYKSCAGTSFSSANSQSKGKHGTRVNNSTRMGHARTHDRICKKHTPHSLVSNAP